jgi:hypothetical protein
MRDEVYEFTCISIYFVSLLKDDGGDELRQIPPAANRQDEQWRSVKEDTNMPRLQSKLLDADQSPFDDMKRWTPIKERAGLDDWRGRFWLPDGDRVDTTRKYCLIRDDGRTGEIVMDQFITSEGAEDKRNSLAMSVSLTI